MKFEVQNGCFSYPHTDKTILNGINFSLDKGDIMTVLGPNGAGKTTLLRCMTGLLKWGDGTTLVDGTPIKEIPQKVLWSKISYVPQAHRQMFASTVEQAVLLGRASSVNAFAMPAQKDMEAVDECLKRCNIEELRHRLCSEISGGEYQMVLFARALVSNPEILVLDEPESNLDFKNQLLVLNMIAKLAREGITVIFNTHYPAHALRVGNKALMLSKSGEYRFGEINNVINTENIRKFFGVNTEMGQIHSGDITLPYVMPVSID
ncbi:MAG: ABC transporter ATP-binding protein [Oscillospiraceae bacterium]|nr:ABC transporter ATP-binding protein [Candidatus Equicaccousia limihippi]